MSGTTGWRNKTVACSVCNRALPSNLLPRHIRRHEPGYVEAQRAAHLAHRRAHPWRPAPSYRRPTRRPATAVERYVDCSNERARKYGAPGHLSYRDIPDLPVGPCAYCGGDATSWDHVVPLVRGGENAIANLAPSCLVCNQRKNARLPDEIEPVALLCGWCWSVVLRSPLRLASSDRRGRRYVTCGRECRNRLHAWRLWLGRAMQLPGGIAA